MNIALKKCRDLFATSQNDVPIERGRRESGYFFFVSFEVKQNCLLFERVDKCPVLLGISSLKLNYSLLRDYGNAFQHCEVKHEIKNYAILKELIALPTIFATHDIYWVYNFSSPMGLHVREKIHH